MSPEIHPQAAVAPGYLANHAARVFNRTVDARLREHGLTLALIGPLLLLNWKGSMLQRDLVQASAIKQPAMVALLDKLESMAMIAREVLPSDKRAATVSLTDAGVEAARIGGRILHEVNDLGVAGFTPEEAALFIGFLGRLIGNLENPSS
jgi:MarR family transcriptional regulator for hemolysin